MTTGPSGGSYGRSLTPDAKATIYFTGTRIDWIGMKGVTPGIVEVYLDDVLKATLDLYAPSAKYQVMLWSSGPLTNGTHHMDLVRAKASLSTEYLVLDAVDIYGGNIVAAPAAPKVTSVSPTSGTTAGGTAVTIIGTNFTGATSVTFGGAAAAGVVVNSAGTQITAVTPAHAAGAVPVQVTTPLGASTTVNYTYVTPPAYTRYEQGNTNIVKTGTWKDFLTTGPSGGSYGRSLTPDAKATIYFTGTRIDWIGMKGLTPGIVEVYLDDVLKATLDLYASPAKYQVMLWSSGPLTNGTHHMDLVRAKASLSTEYLVLDAVDIYGGNIIAAP